MERVACDNEAIFACRRTKEGRWHTNSVLAVMNMSGEEQEVTLDLTGHEGQYTCLCGKEKELQASQTFTLKPWSFKIFEK
jgi:hypothetical protein